jgi:hypothetical protein
MSCSAMLCRQHGCDKLKRVRVEIADGIRMRTYCSVTDKVPCDMPKCPLGVY